MAADLNNKQKRFIAEYLVDANAKQAAIRAGYSPKTAESQGSRLLRNAKVKSALEAKQGKVADKLDLKAEDVIKRLVEVLDFDIGKAFDAQGRLLALTDMPEEIRRCISSIETDELYVGGGERKVEIGQVRKVKFWDKLKAAELLGKNLQLWLEKQQIDHNVTITVVNPYAERV